MTCQHCFQHPTTHPSGYCRTCRIWVDQMTRENAADVRRQDDLYICNECSTEFEPQTRPAQCPDCQSVDVDKWTDRLERSLEER